MKTIHSTRRFAAMIGLCTLGTMGAMSVAEDAHAAVIGGREIWRATVLDGEADWKIHTGYARAVARLYDLSAFDKDCSSFLIGDSVMVTAEHCVASALEPGSRKNVAYYPATSEFDADREREGRARAKQLGIEDVLSNRYSGERDTTRLYSGKCRFALSEGDRDTALYSCEKIELDDGRWVYPGHVWGYIPVQTGIVAEGQRVYGIGVPGSITGGANSTDSIEIRDKLVLATHGEVTASRRASNNGYTNLFATSLDVFGGMSGGPILNASHRAIGVFSAGGTTETLGGYFGSAIAACGRDASRASCPAATDERPTVRPRFASSVRGTRVGTPLSYAPYTVGASCPDGQIAIGVAYNKTQTATPRVATFALVCAYPRAQTFELDNATVASAGIPGQDDYSGAPSVGYGYLAYNTFMHERARNAGNEPATLQLCGPGYALITVMAETESGYVKKITSLTCRPVSDQGVVDATPGRSRSFSVEPRSEGVNSAAMGCQASSTMRGMIVSRNSAVASLEAMCARAL